TVVPSKGKPPGFSWPSVFWKRDESIGSAAHSLVYVYVLTVSVPPPNFFRVSDFSCSFHWYISTLRISFTALAWMPRSSAIGSTESTAPETWTSLPWLALFTASEGTLTTAPAPSVRLLAVVTARLSFQNRSGKATM